MATTERYNKIPTASSGILGNSLKLNKLIWNIHEHPLNMQATSGWYQFRPLQEETTGISQAGDGRLCTMRRWLVDACCMMLWGDFEDPNATIFDDFLVYWPGRSGWFSATLPGPRNLLPSSDPSFTCPWLNPKQNDAYDAVSARLGTHHFYHQVLSQQTYNDLRLMIIR